MKKKLFYLLVFLPAIAQAQTPPSVDDLETLVSPGGDIFNLFVALGYFAAVGGMIYAGILYFTAAGNEENAGKAKQAIIAVVVGLAIIVFSQVIVNTLWENPTPPVTP